MLHYPCRFSIENLYEEKKYLLNLNQSMYFESSGGPLSHDILFMNYILPKQVCNWKSDFFIKGVYLNRK